MSHLDRRTLLRALARRYQRAEGAGFDDIFLVVVCAAGGVATGGVVLLAFVQSHVVLVLALVLALAATLAVLVTMAAMLGAEEAPRASADPSIPSEPVAPPGRPERRFASRSAHPPKARLPR